MKKLLLTIAAICSLSLMNAQTPTPTENYIKSTSYQVKTTDGVHLAGSTTTDLNQDDKIETVTYFDGLGRPKQSIAKQAGGNKEDIITHIDYDDYGRQVKDYLPYTNGSGSLSIRAGDIELDITNFYNTTKYENTLNPYSEKHFEPSPLNRVLEQAAPGDDWKLNETSDTDSSNDDQDHTIKFEYGTNAASDNVRLFSVDLSSGSPELVDNNDVYQPNELYKTITKDENWNPSTDTGKEKNHTTEEYKDKQGRVILKRTHNYVTEGRVKLHDTYYVYDDYGNLTYVLPPELNTYKHITQYTDQPSFFGYYYEEPNPFFDGSPQLEQYFEVYFYYNQFAVVLEGYSTSGSNIGLAFKDTKLRDSNLSIPDTTIGDIMVTNPSGQSVSGATVYIQDGDIYINSHDVIIDSSGYYFSAYIDLETFQPAFTPPVILDEDLNKLAYQYKYDERNRLIEKKIPGKEWEYIVYDKLDRPVLTQDTNLKSQGTWLFTKYDAFGRVIYTGVFDSNSTRDALQTIFNNKTNASQNYETKANSGTGYVNTYYNNTNFPYTGLEILTINYYDDYTFDKDGISLPVNYEGQDVINYNNTNKSLTKSLATGSKVLVLNTTPAKWITTVTGYDTKGRPIYVGSKNEYLETTDLVASKIDFSGAVDKMQTYHNKGTTTIITEDFFTYDHMGRLTKQTQELNDTNTLEVIVENHYDELGQLESKGVGGDNTNRLQDIDYTYNIRGWLKGINDTNNIGSDLFTFGISYNDSGSSSTNLYNGNISKTQWRTNNEDDRLKQYSYKYDALNRFTKSYYAEAGNSNSKYNTYINGYDRNGNILNLRRYMPTDLENPYNSGSRGMDNLTYNYDGNKLLNVRDTYGLSTAGAEGFKDGNVKDNTGVNDYTYDDNGNMVKDLNKNIGTNTVNGITYNYLNLPDEVKFDNNNNKKIKYIYDATGVKLRKYAYIDSSTPTITDYAGNYVYEGSSLKFFNHPEGYIEPKNPNNLALGYDYVYQYKDHLGNIRLSYKDMDGNGSISQTGVFSDGFENDSGWSSSNTSGGLTYYADFKFSGNKCGMINKSTSGEKYFYSDTWTPINNTSTTEYTFSGWVYSAGPSADLAFFMKDGSTVTHDYVRTSVTNQWVYIEKTVSVPSNIDHLRLRIDNNGGGVVLFDDVKIKLKDSEIVEENNYYPFGLRHKGYNNNPVTNHPYKYNGQELNEELGYNVYDYQARHYDPVLGRWLQLDPLAEDMTRFSPYNFAFGNPIYYIDPDGMSPYDNYFIYADGSQLRQKTDDKTDTFTYVDGGGTKHKIGTYDKNDSGLIQIPSIDYDSGDTSVTINTKDGNEDRQYISGSALGSLIGASADSGEEIFVVSASESDGKSPSPSKSHKDGKNLDLRYAGKDGSRSSINYKGSKKNFDKIDTKASTSMNASLKKFGYKDIKSSTLTINTTTKGKDGKDVTTSTNYSVPGTKHLKNHYDHEHLQGYSPNVTTRNLPKPVSTIKASGIIQ